MTGPSPADVVAATVDGQTVVYGKADQSLHLLDPVASVVWSLLDGTATLDETVRDLAEVYGAPVEVVRADVEALVTRLTAAGLLR